MAAGRSFAEYVKNKCYNGLFSAAEDYIRDNADNSILLIQMLSGVQISLIFGHLKALCILPV